MHLKEGEDNGTEKILEAINADTAAVVMSSDTLDRRNKIRSGKK
jgi:hypothetical protein